ncbi:BLUF domain-containing protein [Celeribacter indicus]|uniref:BLUF domain-containing protein n=1 Tax=Celeribacter indicus TaxID=1208324 RepID=A0A0B5E0Q7_9RHOB|nr:BLUF domain-containing protein [Celeribacter indicus]AJE46047.1 BLUF domain-containing protein [Celeribacter indicus]SDX33642.1 Sensors of blue-light using FAD [Celeribacter indicus]
MSHTLVLYRSIATYDDFHPSDLEILRRSLAFNSRHGVTGLLLRVDGQFVQALHGAAPVIAELLQRIALDPRHREMDILLEEPADAVSPYGDWSMGYDSLLGFQFGLDLAADGSYPPLPESRVQKIRDFMENAARGVSDFGSGFPYARKSGEDDRAYIARLERLA